VTFPGKIGLIGALCGVRKVGGNNIEKEIINGTRDRFCKPRAVRAAERLIESPVTIIAVPVVIAGTLRLVVGEGPIDATRHIQASDYRVAEVTCRNPKSTAEVKFLQNAGGEISGVAVFCKSKVQAGR
jgi:hypothetical protein